MNTHFYTHTHMAMSKAAQQVPATLKGGMRGPPGSTLPRGHLCASGAGLPQGNQLWYLHVQFTR